MGNPAIISPIETSKTTVFIVDRLILLKIYYNIYYTKFDQVLVVLTLSGRLGHLHLADAFYGNEVGEKSRPEGVEDVMNSNMIFLSTHDLKNTQICKSKRLNKAKYLQPINHVQITMTTMFIVFKQLNDINKFSTGKYVVY